MDQQEPKYGKSEDISGTDTGGIKPTEIKQEGYDTRLGQLEILVKSLEKEHEKIESSRRWLIGTIIAIIGVGLAIAGGIFTGFTIYVNLIKNSQDVQSNYYGLLIENKDEVNKYIINSEKEKGCLQKNTYFEYKNCILEIIK